MALSENIKKRRLELHLSQEYVADQLGISRQAVAKWESGKSQPSSANLVQLASLFEISVLELVGEKKQKEISHLKRMHVGRVGGYILINGGWDGYFSGLYSDLPIYWLVIFFCGVALLLRTSIDMNRRHKMDTKQIILGAGMLFSIFFLPNCIPIIHVSLRYFLADILTAIFLIVLNLQYWRYIWKV